MKFSQLRTYWNADDAYLILSFLDELRDVIWTTYGADIIEHQQAEQPMADQGDRQLALDID
jgi:hypothetical protein